ncbi:MAG: hypothetical protein A2X56_08315 [Nitrospirae bacterium GWC2_57_13]|nr:MAG: hypothetical protein A2X56_08315 [Nitrospirae bacterium GWC2_57_13]HAR45006.1 hypothetical protein [Nitrospiraceae bacterium]
MGRGRTSTYPCPLSLIYAREETKVLLVWRYEMLLILRIFRQLLHFSEVKFKIIQLVVIGIIYALLNYIH